MKFRPEIDGLRAFAVISAVIYHAFPGALSGGYIGVDVFFVISGYLITSILISELQAEKFSFSEFFGRRVRRIFPSLVFVLAMTSIFGWFFMLPAEYSQLGKHTAASAVFIQNFVFWSESGYFDPSGETKLLLHLWSLAVEEQYYLLWPLALWFVWQKNASILKLMIGVAVFSFILNIAFVSGETEAVFFWPIGRFWELLLGAVMAWMSIFRKEFLESSRQKIDRILAGSLFRYSPSLADTGTYNVLSFTGIALLFGGVLFLPEGIVYPGIWALIPVLGSAFVIAGGAEPLLSRVVLSNKVALWFGAVSYPLYLWHWPLLSYGNLANAERASVVFRVSAVLLSIFLAWFTYHFVENPFRFGAYKKQKIQALCLGLVLLGGFGWVNYKFDGLEFRFPANVRQFTDNVDFKWSSYVQGNTCYLEEAELLLHDPSCYQGRGEGVKVALWGDSHGAALYPGLKALSDQYDFELIQLTHAACPSLFGVTSGYRKDCPENAEQVLRELSQAKPDLIILHSSWKHDDYPLTPEELRVSLENTVDRLKATLPESKLLLIGPVPRWQISPQRESFINLDRLSGKVSEMQPATMLRDYEATIKNVALEQSIGFMSALDVFCNEQGECLARVGDKPTDFTAIDYGHISKAGSEYFATHIATNLLAYLGLQSAENR